MAAVSAEGSTVSASSEPGCWLCRCWPARQPMPWPNSAAGRSGWPARLARRALSTGFILAATLVGTALNFAGISPIRALLWSAVINGVLAVPVLVAMMLVAIKPAVMGGLALSWRLAAVGWLRTAANAATAVALLVTLAQ
jgi:Mn2+/Fe2+ NRAMP family transporter